MPQPSTAVSIFNPSFGDITLEAFSRCQIRPTALTSDHLYQARLSAGFMQSDWGNEQPNRWKIRLVSLLLTQGISRYNLPLQVLTIFDSYIRPLTFGGTITQAPQVSVAAGSDQFTVVVSGHNLLGTRAVQIGVPISVGGVVLYGVYQAETIIDPNTITIRNPFPAVTSAVLGGQVPQFTTLGASPLVTVTLPSHGYVAGQTFLVDVSTSAGGLTLLGTYPISSVTDQNNFVINAGTNATTSVGPIFENGGSVNFLPQSGVATDYFIAPISETEYASQPGKDTQSRPTTHYFERILPPAINLWQAPDGNGPYIWWGYCAMQDQDIALLNGATTDVPFRFLDAFAAGLSARLAEKFQPALAERLSQRATIAFGKAGKADAEPNVPIFIYPGLESYFR